MSRMITLSWRSPTHCTSQSGPFSIAFPRPLLFSDPSTVSCVQRVAFKTNGSALYAGTLSSRWTCSKIKQHGIIIIASHRDRGEKHQGVSTREQQQRQTQRKNAIYKKVPMVQPRQNHLLVHEDLISLSTLIPCEGSPCSASRGMADDEICRHWPFTGLWVISC